MRLEFICTQQVIKQRHISSSPTVNCKQLAIQCVFIIYTLTLCQQINKHYETRTAKRNICSNIRQYVTNTIHKVLQNAT